LSFAEREDVGLLSAQGIGVREIARRIEGSPSTVSRELRRNAATRGGKLEYRASVAQWKAELIATGHLAACVAYAALDRDDVDSTLAEQVSHALVRGIRHKPVASVSRRAHGEVKQARFASEQAGCDAMPGIQDASRLAEFRALMKHPG
jgi:IS30 family transposase